MRRFRRAIVAVLALALVAGAIYAIVAVLQRSETLVTERCFAVAGPESHELATDQAANASLITAISVQRGLPPRAASYCPWPRPCRSPGCATSITATTPAPTPGDCSNRGPRRAGEPRNRSWTLSTPRTRSLMAWSRFQATNPWRSPRPPKQSNVPLSPAPMPSMKAWAGPSLLLSPGTPRPR